MGIDKKFNIEKVNINFLINSIYCFRGYRRENLKVFNNIYQRLDAFFGNSRQGKKTSFSLSSLFAKLIALVSLALRQFLRLPHYIIQTLSL